MKKRILSILLTLALVMSLLPQNSMPVLAAETEARWGMAAADGSAPTVWETDGIGSLNNAMTYANTRSGGTAYIQLLSNVSTWSSLDFQKPTILDLNGHDIDRGHTTAASSGFVIKVSNDLTLKDSSTTVVASQGCITGGYNAIAGGGGVNVQGNFTMQGGNITGNKSTFDSTGGGGVFVAFGKNFTMQGGRITDNEAKRGGGIFANGAAVTMTGGRITGNKSGSSWGGVVASTLTVGGTAVIENNTGIVSPTTENNVTMMNLISVSTVTPLTSGASIGVSSFSAPTSGSSVNITYQNTGDYSSYFTSDNSSYLIQNSASNVVQLAVPTYTITVDSTSKDFGSQEVGSAVPAAQTVTVTNTGNTSLALTQPTSINYTIGALSTTTLAAGGTATFTIQPKAGMGVGTYPETITVSSNHSTSATVSVTYVVTATPTYTITVDSTSKDFGSQEESLAVPEAQTVTVTNTGNTSLTLTQPTSTNYTIGALSATTLAASGTATFTIQPKAGLGVGTYPETITVSSNHSTSATINVIYVVTAAPDPDIAVVEAAKLAALNAIYSNMTQAVATNETVIIDALKATAEAAVNNGTVTVTINKVSYTAPIAGTSADPVGTDGSYVFTITVSKGLQSQTTTQKTIAITATAYTGITDVQAVAAAKAALVDGSVNVAFGADQTAMTAAVQSYVNGILSGTLDASGVSAMVTFDNSTGNYEVALSKGSANDSKSLTMTLNVSADPDITVVNNTRLAVEGESYANMTQAIAISETVISDALKTTAVTAVTGSAITVTINKISYTEPIAGTSANPSGTNGSYVFTITISKGVQSQTTTQKTITITATAYTGITDVQAVAAAKAALVDGSVNVAFGADQATKTAAVQSYVNGVLSGTAYAAGASAIVTYNSGTGKYDIALNKGSENDSKSLTMTVTVAPAPSGPSSPSGGSPTTATETETKTIKVIEVPQSIPEAELLTVEPVGEAFDNSVEVRLKEDKVTEGMVRTAMEMVFSTLNLENAQIFSMDISIYLKGTDTKVQPKEGTAVMIICPIPTDMLANMDKLVVVCVIDGELQVLPATLVTKDGVPCVQFTATHFSPYALVIDNDNKLSDYAAGTLPDEVTNIITKLTATAGTLTKIDLDGIKEGSVITYHVCTPTLISIDSNGNLFTKKAGNAILIANVTYDGATTVYTTHITVKNAKGGTKVGFIRYYEDIITYNKINYRITAKATDTAQGTVAVANNQINKNLPNKVVIPATITYKGKTYKVTSIDESAFYNLNKITSVTIPSGVEEISSTAFVSCDSLKTFTVSSGNKHYSAKKGMLLNKEGTLLIAYPSAKGTIVIDKKIEVIGAYAFSACKYLKGVVIPKTVTRIEGCAFAHSKSLTRVTFQSMTVPEIPYLCTFEKVNGACTILVPETSLIEYQAAFENTRLPKGASVNRIL